MWKTVVGYPGYEVSDAGDVLSLLRRVPCACGSTRTQYGRLLKAAIAKNGYRVVTLRRHNRSHTVYVQRLVAAAFVPRSEPEATVVMHLGDDKTDNRAVNLAWGTAAENMRSARENGLIPVIRGEARKNAELTDDLVRLIRHRCKAGASERCLARELGIPRSRVAYALRGGWTHVPSESAPAGGNRRAR